MSTRIAVHVQPKAKANDIALQPDGILRVRVTTAPEDGKATRAVLDLIANRLNLPKRGVTLFFGTGAGALAAFVVAFLLERMNTSFRSTDELEAYLRPTVARAPADGSVRTTRPHPRNAARNPRRCSAWTASRTVRPATSGTVREVALAAVSGR